MAAAVHSRHLQPARVEADFRRGFEIPEQPSPSAGSSFEREGWALAGCSDSLKLAVVRRRTWTSYSDGFQPVQIPAGSALGDLQGYLADPPRDYRHPHNGVRDGRVGVSV